jgi:ubiquinone/menaquinone biosynthesis C-methylase UbiE
MKLNLAETLLVNNPARALVQRFYELPLLRRLGGRLDGAHVLEIGCGRGAGVQLILEQFGPNHIDAIDLDPRQIARAQRRLDNKYGTRVALSVGSAESLPFPDAAFDAVFDFGILHHAQNWQAAIAEIRRVLQPNGRFFFEEVTRAALNRWVYRTFLDHPVENRFDEAEFLAELALNGLQPMAPPHRILFNDIFIGVARHE